MSTSQSEPQALTDLLRALRTLPGVGVRTAKRMAYQLLQHDRQGATDLVRALEQALNELMHCERCNGFSQTPVCPVCEDTRRDTSVLCVVETPADLDAVEASGHYQGLYYVLMGRIAPLDGLGAQEIQLKRLLDRARSGGVKEVILATSFTAEGETTAHYLSQALQAQGITVSRLARGVPSGSELEYVDAGTVAWAMLERKPT